MTFYDLPRSRHMPSPAWSDLIGVTVFDVHADGVDRQINEWIAKDREQVNLLAFTPPVASIGEQTDVWYSTLIYQQKIDPNGGES